MRINYHTWFPFRSGLLDWRFLSFLPWVSKSNGSRGTTAGGVFRLQNSNPKFSNNRHKKYFVKKIRKKIHEKNKNYSSRTFSFRTKSSLLNKAEVSCGRSSMMYIQPWYSDPTRASSAFFVLRQRNYSSALPPSLLPISPPASLACFSRPVSPCLARRAFATPRAAFLAAMTTTSWKVTKSSATEGKRGGREVLDFFPSQASWCVQAAFVNTNKR